MEDERGLLLNWTHFYHQEKIMEDELRQSHLLTVMEMENELKLRDQQISHLKEMIADAIRERDEARDSHQKALFEKILLQQQLLLQQHSAGISSNVVEDHDLVRPNNGGISSSDSDESIVSSPPPPPPLEAEPELPVGLINRPLPEKGKLLQAVMKAGPLLQTLLLAGPLPQWRHPPPPLDSYQIPPPPLSLRQDTPSLLGSNVDSVNVNSNCGEMNRKKRGLLPDHSCDDSFINEFKYQRVVLQ